ncbi:glutamate synthase-related protein [Marinobacter sp.]|uniref:glutamate synthase-related protein n=1 Tax=Marinobacter sp. TaxID=50741 RepID=UPI0025C1F587|nr:glutamate synthase-related protein [Marinobacter sp.]
MNSARCMMMALSCIQSRSCNADKCPTGIATTSLAPNKQLDLTDKGIRVANYQHSPVEALEELQPRRINPGLVMNDAQLYPGIGPGCLLHKDFTPADWAEDWRLARA